MVSEQSTMYGHERVHHQLAKTTCEAPIQTEKFLELNSRGTKNLRIWKNWCEMEFLSEESKDRTHVSYRSAVS